MHMTADELRNLRLGGGTALAMRWNHRLSTDIDYAMERQLTFAFINRARQALNEDLGRRRASGEVKKYRVGWRTATWEYADTGPVSLSASDQRQSEHMDWEVDTGVAVAPTYAILRGKLFGRVLDGNKLLVRDGYDLCAAFRHDSEPISTLVQEAKQMRGEDLSNICEAIVSAGRRIVLGRALTDAIHKDLAHDPWGTFVDLVENLASSKATSKRT